MPSLRSRAVFEVDGEAYVSDIDELNRRIAVGRGNIQVNGHDVKVGESVVVDSPAKVTGKGLVVTEPTSDDADKKVATPKDEGPSKSDQSKVSSANEEASIPSFTPEPDEVQRAEQKSSAKK